MSENRPLVVALDETVLDEILRIAAVTGCELDRAPDPVAARARWGAAPLIVLDEAAAALRADLPRRTRVVLVCKGAPEPRTWEHAFHSGADHVIALPDDEAALAGLFADVVDAPAGESGVILAVIGGRGGAGASVLAGALALQADREPPGALLIDCDPLGGGLDVLLGMEKTPGPRWPQVHLTGRVSIPALTAALPACRHETGALPVLSCGRDGPSPTPEALSAVITAGRRAGRTVVCDLPRTPDEASTEVVRTADLVTVVVPLEIRACLAAKQVVNALADHTNRIALVACGHSFTGDAPPSKAAAILGHPLITTMPPDRTLPSALEAGDFRPRPRSPLTRAARAILTAARTP